MKISDCMSRDVRVCTPDNTLQSAAQTMAEIDAGFLPVGDNDRLIGIVTDRDIAVRGVARGKPPQASVREVMSDEICFCYDDDDTEDVVENMSQIQVRRLPVVDHDKRLVGVIALSDIARGADHATTGEALCDIARPSGQHSQAV